VIGESPFTISRRIAVSLLELERVRLEADVEAIHLARLERLGLRVQVIRLHLGAVLLIERAMRGAQPALRHDLIRWLMPFARGPAIAGTARKA